MPKQAARPVLGGRPVAVTQIFCAALRRTLEILTAATRSPCCICHRQRTALSPFTVEQKQLDELHIAIVGEVEKDE